MKLTWKNCGFAWPKRRPVVLACLGLMLAAPAILSPTHPVAVYGFLLDTYGAPLKNQAYASVTTNLAGFLTSESQVQQYRNDLRADVADTRSGKFFVISRQADGTLQQDGIRTWNDFLPAGLSPSIDTWLDHKEFPFLGDEVEVWLRGDRIEAVGHYHAYGGPPSRGDALAERFTGLPEVVVVNGLVPFVYMNRDLVEYGQNVQVTHEVFRSMRSLESMIRMNVDGQYLLPESPTGNLKSFLGYLRDHRGVDIESLEKISGSVEQLSHEIERDYAAVLPKGFHVNSYKANDPDAYNFLSALRSLRCWSVAYNMGGHFTK